MATYSISSEDQSESVYNLLEHHTPPKKKGKRYKSKYNPKAPPTGSTFALNNTSVPGVANVSGDTDRDHRNDDSAGHKVKRSTGGMGRSVKETISPQGFITKGKGFGGTSGKVNMTLQNTQKKFSGYKTKTRKDPVPTRKEKPIMGLKTKKNYVTSNAVENILSVSKKVPPKDVRYTEKPEYGKVPEYLNDVKREVEDEYDYIRQMQELQQEPGQTRRRRRDDEELELLPEDERLKVLEALKQKWRELNNKYNKLSFNLPAPSFPISKKEGAPAMRFPDKPPMLDKTKVSVKEKYEQELDQIEKDIEKFSKPNVYIHQGYL